MCKDKNKKTHLSRIFLVTKESHPDLMEELKEYSKRVVGKTKIIVKIKTENYGKYILGEKARVNISCLSHFNEHENGLVIFNSDLRVTKKEVDKKTRIFNEFSDPFANVEEFLHDDIYKNIPSFIKPFLRGILKDTLPRMEKEFKSIIK